MSERESVSGASGRQLKPGESEEIVRGPLAPDDLSLLRNMALQGQKMEAIGRLSAGAAHDFNNLLTVIIGTAELRLASLAPADPVRRDLEEIRSAGERASRMVKQVLRFSRRSVSEPQSIDTVERLRELERVLRRVLGEDIEVATRLEAKLSWVKIDATHFDVVIMNLAGQARDSMPSGGKLRIECANVAGPGGPWLEVRVQDTGIGFTEEEKNRLFECWHVSRPRGRSAGLALASSRSIVAEAGGSLRVESDPGQGALFRILLPVCERGAREAVAHETTAVPTRGTETVMVVEDDAAVRRLCAEALEREGYRVVCAKDSTDAVALSRHDGRIHLLITNFVLQGTSGRSLFERIRYEQPGLRVLYTCGHGEEAFGGRSSPDDEAAVLRKPFSPRRLARRARTELDGV